MSSGRFNAYQVGSGGVAMNARIVLKSESRPLVSLVPKDVSQPLVKPSGDRSFQENQVPEPRADTTEKSQGAAQVNAQKFSMSADYPFAGGGHRSIFSLNGTTPGRSTSNNSRELKVSNELPQEVLRKFSYLQGYFPARLPSDSCVLRVASTGEAHLLCSSIQAESFVKDYLVELVYLQAQPPLSRCMVIGNSSQFSCQ